MSHHYIVRVELYGEQPSSVYDILHRHMEAQGFSRTANIGAVKCHLPTAEYYLFSDVALESVLSRAKAAAAATGKAAGVLASQVEAAAQDNLRRA